MAEPRTTVTVSVEYNTEDAELGPVYIASCDDLMFTTEGRTFEELLAHVRECLLLNLHDTDSLKAFNVAANARVVLLMELSQDYAQTA